MWSSQLGETEVDGAGETAQGDCEWSKRGGLGVREHEPMGVGRSRGARSLPSSGRATGTGDSGVVGDSLRWIADKTVPSHVQPSRYTYLLLSHRVFQMLRLYNPHTPLYIYFP